MKKLLLLTPLLLMGCGIGMNNGGGGSFGSGFNPTFPGVADEYTCESAGDNAAAYYATGEHPNLSDC